VKIDPIDPIGAIGRVAQIGPTGPTGDLTSDRMVAPAGLLRDDR
jgi:hypothetical protein